MARTSKVEEPAATPAHEDAAIAFALNAAAGRVVVVDETDGTFTLYVGDFDGDPSPLRLKRQELAAIAAGLVCVSEPE